MKRLWCSGFAKSGESEPSTNATGSVPERSQVGRIWERFLAKRSGSPVGIPTAIYEYDGDGSTCRVTIADDLDDASGPSVTVPEGWYLRCISCGPQPAAVNQAWKEIHRLCDEGKIRRSYKADYELYVSASRIEVYVAVGDAAVD
jgi:hypothetical protein